ncbi:MAG: hypothetical protein KF716_04295 [Anaerolineae bacterium]|nr:hypothetical protein [Anaerolineae bacterium]
MRSGIPRFIMRLFGSPSFLRGIIGLVICAPLFAAIYYLLRFLTGNPMDWTLPDGGGASGATLLFAGLGGAIGMLLGVGGFSPGSSAHEGPYVTYLENAEKEHAPGLLQIGLQNLVKFINWARPHIVSNIRPLLIALGVVIAIVAIIMFIGANPIVRVARTQTYDVNASVASMTGDKFLWFVLVVVVVFVSLIGAAFLLSLVMTSVSRQVEVAKKMKVSRLPDDSPVNKLGRYFERLIEFNLAWVRDIVEWIRVTSSR